MADQTPHRYNAALAATIEAKWQDYWEEHRTFHIANPGEQGFDAAKPKKFIMDMFPYPSGVGLHVGHVLGYSATDIYARFQRMRGCNVLHPMGFDAFGLPAEQYAIQTGQHPRATTEKNIATMRAQMRRLGLGHDPDRFLATTDVEFYRWTQWIFLQMYNSWFDPDTKRARPIDELIRELREGKRAPAADGRTWSDLSEGERAGVVDGYRLAFLADLPVNWCPMLGTVLANEEVTAEGRSERGDFPVYKRPLRQWMLRITAYCERLLEDLEPLDWPEPTKLMQRNWIGRSEGAEVDFLAEVAGGREPAAWFGARAKSGWTDGAPPEAEAIRVFTTRPDTLYGATYMVLAPEHPLVDALTAETWPAETLESWRGSFPGAPRGGSTPRELVEAYRAYAAGRTDVERQVEEKTKTGVFTGSFAVNPVNRERVPIFIADYVLMGYGTGAIMAVPAHDERDFEFATQFDLPVPPVVLPPNEWLRENVAPHLAEADVDAADGELLRSAYRHAGDETHELGRLYRLTAAYSGLGQAFHSESIEGLHTPEAKRVITAWLEERGLGHGTVNYRLRDWLFSRQRYWGEPFPIAFAPDGRVIALSDADLPVELPEMDDYEPEVDEDPDSMPRPPLARARDWARVTIDGEECTRELNTMPNWAGSCWYYLRYLDPRNDRKLVDEKVESYWMLTPREKSGKASGGDPEEVRIGGVDLYVGGVEHAVLHLLYARFWHKVLYDLGHVSTPEPFHKLFNQGYVQGAAYRDERGVYVEASEVVEKDGEFYHGGKPVTREFGKIGKSLKNSVNPDDVCREYGADTLRLYAMYMGPLDASKPWNPRDTVGVHRFLQRLWRNLIDEETGRPLVSPEPASDDVRRSLHRTIAAVEKDMESLAFNTAIARLIELNNQLVPLETVPAEVAEPLVKMLAPMAPHISEELWERMGREGTIAYEPYPESDATLIVADEVEIPVMVNGKLRARVKIPSGADRGEQESAARGHPKISGLLAGKSPKKVIVVPGKMVNFVV